MRSPKFCISDHHFIILPSSEDQHILTQAVVETTKILTELAVDKITREEEVDMSYFPFIQAWSKSTDSITQQCFQDFSVNSQTYKVRRKTASPVKSENSTKMR